MINVAVEGESDREIARVVVRVAGKDVNLVRVARGKSRLDQLIPKYNRASTQTPWVVFRDSDAECPVVLRAKLAAGINRWESGFVLRIAHSMSEAWLLADPDGFSEYFNVPRSRIPSDPELLRHAKQKVLALCAGSRSRLIRQDMTSNGSEIGPLYVAHVNEFASTVWNPTEAALASDSLRRAIERIRDLPPAL